MSEQELETTHDWEAWLFPNFTKRPDKETPSLTKPDAAAFLTDLELKANALTSLEKVKNFWGLSYGLLTFGEAGKPVWVSSNNLNYFRLARVLIFLTECQFYFQAQELFGRLDVLARQYPEDISKEIYDLWRTAAKVN